MTESYALSKGTLLVSSKESFYIYLVTLGIFSWALYYIFRIFSPSNNVRTAAAPTKHLWTR
ncbi:hypothetical protein BJX61DRAFT_507137 [Aspergillus egyptiacus]|nr:hypothetical protein BJX61DRAFT_507137 [Aspergillus egyptiacus]